MSGDARFRVALMGHGRMESCATSLVPESHIYMYLECNYAMHSLFASYAPTSLHSL